MKKGLKEDESFHNYSNFPFLQDLDNDIRKKFQYKIIDAVQNHDYDFKVDEVNPEYVEIMEQYLENLRQLDVALRGRFKEMGPFTKGFDDLFIQYYHTLKEHRPKNDEVVALCEEMVTRHKFYNTRSRYL